MRALLDTPFLQLWRRLKPGQRALTGVLVAGNVAASLLEVLGLMLFGMVLARITQGADAPSSRLLGAIRSVIGGSEMHAAIMACGLVYLVKNATMAALAWLESRLAFGVQNHLSAAALAAVLAEDYEAASRHDPTKRVNLLTLGMNAVSLNLLLPAMTLFAEGTLMLALVLFLVLTQPTFIVAILLTLCTAAVVLVLVSRRLVLRLGRKRQHLEEDRLRLLSGIFSHLREVYIYAAGGRAVQHLQRQLEDLGAAMSGFQMLYTLPRFALEVTLVGGLLVALSLQGEAGIAPSVVVSVGVFGVAGFRLLLGINRLVSSVQGLRFTRAVVEQVVEALSSPPAPRSSERGRSGAAAGSLCLRQVSYAYALGTPVLQGIDFELPRRGLIAIKGRSGAGKSTFLEVIAGLRAPSSGCVELDGKRIRHKEELLGRVAYAGQQPAVFPDTIRANVAFGVPPEAIDDDAVWHALGRAHLDELVQSLTGRLDHLLGSQRTLSGGQVQRLALARALYMDCDYLLLDEPTAALDAETEQDLLATFRELAATTGVIVVSHRAAPLRAADVVWELAGGRLVKASQPNAREPQPAPDGRAPVGSGM